MKKIKVKTSMKKWIGCFISLFLIAVFLVVSGPSSKNLRPTERVKKSPEAHRMLLSDRGNREEGTDESDPHLIQILKIVREKIEDWLKSLDERIESEDITRFEVRFLEILRNILEWVKEKIDAKIASSEDQKPRKKERGFFRETHEEVSPGLRPC